MSSLDDLKEMEDLAKKVALEFGHSARSQYSSHENLVNYGEASARLMMAFLGLRKQRLAEEDAQNVRPKRNDKLQPADVPKQP